MLHRQKFHIDLNPMTTRVIEQSLLGMISMKFRSLWHRRPIREASPTVRNVDRRPYSQARLACTDGVYGLPMYSHGGHIVPRD